MAVSDLEAFIRERLGIYDAALDATPGSPMDSVVIQPLLRRLGTDPFTVDFIQFAQDRLQQEFPELATKDGDAITDLLVKPATLLLDPVIREAVRLKNAQSFKDPSILTTDEADALGSNLFALRSTGDTARGVGRVYFSAPQAASISPANFFTSRGGLHFFPTSVQSIRADEMLFNAEGSLYYFDCNVQAEAAGDQYNIGADELVSIANIASAVRVTNKRRFRFGVPAETAVDFIGRARQELSEHSLVTERGVRSRVSAAFSEVTQVAVVGFGDEEMQRDIIEGGGLGSIQASGFLLHPTSDTENAVSTRRVVLDATEAGATDFTALIGPAGPVDNFVLTVHGGFSSVPQVRDLIVKAVVSADTLDLEEQVLDYNLSANLPWVLRKKELTLSGIPGGILFPDAGVETASIPSDTIHIGGTTDIFIRATDFDSSSLILDSVVDDSPLLSGHLLDSSTGAGVVTLDDLVFDTDYAINDATYTSLQLAALKGFSLQILDGPAAGSYRIITVSHTSGLPVSLVVDPQPDTPSGTFRWRLLDVLDINLVDPKETKLSGSDLITTQNIDSVTTAAGVDLQEFGVGPNDVLRIENGPDAGDYVILQVLTPLYQRVQLDRKLTTSGSSLRYTIFRANVEGGVKLPLIRINSVELLDPSGQSTGTKIPYAKPVDVRSRNFANVAHGIKEDLTDARLGLVGQPIVANPTIIGKSLDIRTKTSKISATTLTTITFAIGGARSPAQIAAEINTLYGRRIAVTIDNRVCILPFSYAVWIVATLGDATSDIFGPAVQYSTADVRSQTIDDLADLWASVSPAIDANYDVVEVLDGNQVGFYDDLSTPYSDNTALVSTGTGFFPEIERHVKIGSRSLGVARLFFLEPTSIEFDDSTFFEASVGGQTLRYVTDKTLGYQVLPALPNDSVPKNGVVTTGPKTLASANAEFYRSGVLINDKVQITFQPVQGSQVLADPVPLLAHKTIILSVGGGVDKVLIFVNDDPSAGTANVTRKGVADQINRAVGQKICSITDTFQLEFDADVSVIVRSTGTGNTILGFSTVSDTNNTSPVAGTYTIASFTNDTLTLTESLGVGGPFTRQHFLIVRPRLQRVVSTVMSSQLETAGLYYCDVELISEGTGDQYNIDSAIQMTATGYAADGYWLTTADPNLTFSAAELPVMHISRAILEVGVSDSPVNATQISGQNLQITYERSSLTSSVQSFASSEEERVLCESPLVRHLIPYFVRFDASYVGGSKEDVVIPEVEKFINELEPQESFGVSDLEKILQNRGASSVRNPIDLIAVIHTFDREVTVERSQDRINTGKLAAFIPDVLNIVRKLS